MVIIEENGADLFKIVEFFDREVSWEKKIVKC